MREKDCIFCKIANGDIPSRTIYEDDKFRVILDLSPASNGHALILPKEHYANICEMPEKLTGEAFILAKKMTARMIETLKCDGFNVVQNNGVKAGQTVFHFHIHLIPRYKEDKQDLNWEPLEMTDQELDEIRNQIVGV